MAVFVGIEGVGMRQSFAIAANEQGKILSVVRQPYGISLHTSPRAELISRLAYLIRDLASNMGEPIRYFNGSTICIGLTGVTFPYDAEVELPREFEQLGIKDSKLICTGDAEIVFASHTQSDNGGAILCHMGSTGYIAFGRKHIRFGGWGPALGDEGSGFWIGRAALRAIGEEYDLVEEPPSKLWNQIQDWLQDPADSVEEWSFASGIWRQILNEIEVRKLDPRTAIFAFSHEVCRNSAWQWRVVASGLTIPVMSAWEKGDQKAEQIVKKAAHELWHQFNKARLIAGAPIMHSPIVLYGGVLVHHPPFCELLTELIHSQGDESIKIILPSTEGAMRPVCGALLFALGGSNTRNLCLPKKDVIDRLRGDVSKTYQDTILKND